MIAKSRGRKRTVSSAVNPFSIASRRTRVDEELSSAGSDSFWTCFLCSTRLVNNQFRVQEHVEACLGRSAMDASGAPPPQVSEEELFPRSVRLERRDELVPGLWLVSEFLSESEEMQLIRDVDEDSGTPWRVSSFNGFTDTKVFGVRTQFGLPNEERLVRKNDVSKDEHDIPPYMAGLVRRVSALPTVFPELQDLLRSFKINDCNVNSYERERGHFLTPHFDDRALSGPLLLNLSLGCDCFMTYSSQTEQRTVRVRLPRRCLQIVSGEARYYFKHSIDKEDVLGSRRVSVTFRMSGSKAKGVVGAESNRIEKFLGS